VNRYDTQQTLLHATNTGRGYTRPISHTHWGPPDLTSEPLLETGWLRLQFLRPD